MSIETRTSHLVKKTGVEKSRWTVPLSDFMDKTAFLVIFYVNQYSKPPVYGAVFVFSEQLGGVFDLGLSSSFYVRGRSFHYSCCGYLFSIGRLGSPIYISSSLAKRDTKIVT